jgi:hypothetical protein
VSRVPLVVARLMISLARGAGHAMSRRNTVQAADAVSVFVGHARSRASPLACLFLLYIYYNENSMDHQSADQLRRKVQETTGDIIVV